jgi:NADPH:quinone reductase-like Zn-dependent oxidoreductase
VKKYVLSAQGDIRITDQHPIGLSLTDGASADPGPGQVRVAVKSNSLNFVDLLTLWGNFPVDGRIPLMDGAGAVLSVGAGVTRFKAGDRVVANPHANWIAGAPAPGATGLVLGIVADGVLAEEVILPEDWLVALPEAISFDVAASLPCAGLSAWNSLMGGPGKFNVIPGGTVLTQGTGGVALFALQFAKAMGCRVIATTSSDAKAAKLTSLGADAVINYAETPEWGGKVLELTNGIGADLVVEVGGPNTLPQSLIAAKAGGRIAMVGIVGGMGSIDYAHMLPINHKVLTLFANGMGSRRDLEEMLQFVAVNGIEPVIDSVYPFEDAPDAYRHFAGRGHVGKVLISHAQ